MLRVFIVDDEPPARRRLRKLLEDAVAAGRVQVVGEAGDGIEAVEKLGDTPADLLLLDIQMPGLDGFEVIERLEPGRRPVVVFTTAYDSYALRAFEANAVDYLLKPISRERLNEALQRAERLATTGNRVADEHLEKLLDWLENQSGHERPPQVPKEYLRQLSIPHRDRILVVPVEKLISAEVSEGLTRLYVLSENEGGGRPSVRQYIVNYTLEQLESHLDPNLFMRVHRSAIVNLNHISEMVTWFSGRYKLILTENHEVIASRERSRVLKERLLI
jgi:two-component system, LytTR family, response regulator